MLKDRTAQETLTLCIDQAKSHFVLRAKLGAVPNSLDSTPTKLESFIVYLIRNGVDDSITRLALLEQFSILGKQCKLCVELARLYAITD